MDATKEQIERLIKETSATIGVLYSTIQEDLSILEACDEKVSPLLKLTRELRMNTSYVLVDLHSTMHSLFTSEKPIEKRFHLMFVSADMLECYKLLYNFGKKRKYTVWSKIGKEVRGIYEERKDAHSELLLKLYEAVTTMLEEIGDTQEKDSRDLTYHYDDDLLNVYRCILKFDNEEKLMERVIKFIDVTRSMLFFCDVAESVEILKGHSLPVAEINNKPHFPFQKLIAEKIDEEGKLRSVLEAIMDKTQAVDRAARMKEGMERAQHFFQDKWPERNMPELGNMEAMANTHLLLQIALADIVTATLAYLNAGSEPEYPLVLRRLTITRVSTLSHIYGYHEGEREKSLWHAIIKMMPDTNKALSGELKEIEEQIKGLIHEKDIDDRLLFVHLFDNQTKKSNVPLIVSKIEDMNPFAEFEKANALIGVMSRLQTFLKDLMDELGKNAHEQAERSKAELKAKVQAMRDLINKSGCKEFNEQFDKFEGLIDSIYGE